MKNLFKKIIVPIITWQSMHLLGRFNPKVVAVTGSVGKTSTKDAIYHFLKGEFDVRKSEKSFNSEIGVPLTILGLKNGWLNPFLWSINLVKGFFISFFSRSYPKVLVLEIGADKPGDIESIVRWLRPDIAVLTSLPEVPVHVANFPSVASVHKEKLNLIKALPKDGTAVINGDDGKIIELTSGLSFGKKIIFGKERGEVTLRDISVPEFANPYPVLAGASVAQSLGLSKEKIMQISKEIPVPPGRMRKLEGVNGSSIIDDTYNSSPAAVEFALSVLEKAQIKGKKIVALGDMRELGSFAEEEHNKVGKRVARIADLLITVGPLSKFTASSAKEAGMSGNNVFEFLDSREAGAFLKPKIAQGDLILAKGSQNTIRMERLVLEILANPERDRHLLVRQEDFWQKN